MTLSQHGTDNVAQAQAAWPERRAICRALLGAAVVATSPFVQAQRMYSGTLLSLPQMMDPIVAGRPLREGGVLIDIPVLVDNGFLVPARVVVDSPMTEQDHVTHLYLRSPRWPCFTWGPGVGAPRSAPGCAWPAHKRWWRSRAGPTAALSGSKPT
jgi:hypothetical protein